MIEEYGHKLRHLVHFMWQQHSDIWRLWRKVIDLFRYLRRPLIAEDIWNCSPTKKKDIFFGLIWVNGEWLNYVFYDNIHVSTIHTNNTLKRPISIFRVAKSGSQQAKWQTVFYQMLYYIQWNGGPCPFGKIISLKTQRIFLWGMLRR